MIEKAILILVELKGFTEKEACQYIDESVKIKGLTDTMNDIENMKRSHYLEQHHYSIYYDEKQQKWITTLPSDDIHKRRIIRRKDRKELEDCLIAYYCELTSKPPTLETLFPRWISFRQEETPVKDKTIQGWLSDWRTFYKGADLINKPIKDISTTDITRFFRYLTKDRKYTSKRIYNVSSILNGIFSYALEQGYCDINPAKDINLRHLPYKQPHSDTDNVYSKEDVYTLLTHLRTTDTAKSGYKENDIYCYAIRLMFNLFCRIGELKALKWSDFDFNRRTVYLHAQILECQEWVKNEATEGYLKPVRQEYSDQTKGNSSAGARYQYLTDESLEILEKIKSLRIDSEYVFMDNGHFLYTNIFNRHLKRYCEDVGITYRSSHKIRFYNASTAYTGDNLVQLQKVMGHSSSATTLHYLRNTDKADIRDIFAKLGT